MKKIDTSRTTKDLIKNTGIIGIGRLSTKIINFFLMPLYTAVLAKEEYGLSDLLVSYTTVLIPIVNLQLEQSVFRFMAENREDKKESARIFSAVAVLSTGLLLLYTVIFLLISPFINLQYKWYLLVYVVVAVYFAIISDASRGLGNNFVYAMGNFISALITLLWNVLFVGILKKGVLFLLLASIIGPVFGMTYIFISNRMLTYIKYPKNEYYKKVLKYSLPLIPNELSWWVVHASDRTVVSMRLSIGANGIISVASRFSTIYTTIFSVFNASWLEQVMLHYNDEGGKEYIVNTAQMVLKFFSAVNLLIIAVIPFVFPIMVNSSYKEAYYQIPVYLLAVGFNAIIGILSPIYLINNETKIVAKATIVAAIINIVVDLALIDYIGLYAASVSSVLGYLYIVIFRYIDINRRHMKFQFSKKLLFSLLMAYIIVFVCYYTEIILIEIIGFIFCVVYGIIINKQLIVQISRKFIFNKQKNI